MDTPWQVSASDGWRRRGSDLLQLRWCSLHRTRVARVMAATITTPARAGRASVRTPFVLLRRQVRLRRDAAETASWLHQRHHQADHRAWTQVRWNVVQSAYLSAQDPNTVPSGVKEISYRINDGAWATLVGRHKRQPDSDGSTGALICRTASSRSTTTWSTSPGIRAFPDRLHPDRQRTSRGERHARVDERRRIGRCPRGSHRERRGLGSRPVLVRVHRRDRGACNRRDHRRGSRLITLPPPAVGTADAQVSAYARDWIGNQVSRWCSR